MYSNVNFLKEHNRLQEQILVRDQKIAFWSSVALGLCFVLSLSVFFYNLYLSSQRQLVETEYETTVAEIKKQNTTVANFSNINKKIKIIAELFKKRGNKWDAITYIYSLLPAGSVINSVDLKDGLASLLEMTIESNSIFAFDALSERFNRQDVRTSGYSFAFGTLSRGKDGKYRMSIVVTLDKSKLVTSE